MVVIVAGLAEAAFVAEAALAASAVAVLAVVVQEGGGEGREM